MISVCTRRMQMSKLITHLNTHPVHNILRRTHACKCRPQGIGTYRTAKRIEVVSRIKNYNAIAERSKGSKCEANRLQELEDVSMCWIESSRDEKLTRATPPAMIRPRAETPLAVAPPVKGGIGLLVG